MARLLSTIASNIRGSIGGLTFFSNPFHQIVVRQRTIPVNPMTTRQTEIRAAMGYAQQLYNALSESDKLLWDDYARTLTYQGGLGNYTVPGRQVCLGNVGTAVYLNTRSIDVGTPTAAPPLAPGFLALNSVLVTSAPVGETGFSIVIQNGNPVACTFIANRSIPFGPGRKRYKGPFESESLIADENVATAGSGVIEFIDLNAGSVYFAKIRVITADPPYRISQEYIVRAVAALNPEP
jgi:hypothetical protein